jgi:hypothetical protein
LSSKQPSTMCQLWWDDLQLIMYFRYCQCMTTCTESHTAISYHPGGGGWEIRERLIANVIPMAREEEKLEIIEKHYKVWRFE